MFSVGAWILVLVGVCTSALAEHSPRTTPSPRSAPARTKSSVEFSRNWEAKYEGALTKEQRAYMLTVFEGALGLVASFPPEADNFFGWEKKEAIAGKRVNFRLTSSADAEVRALEIPGGLAKDTDALTVLYPDQKGNAGNIVVYLFMDKLLFDERGEWRKDGPARTSVALAHEIFGNVQSHLETGNNALPQNNWQTRQALEIRAFEAGVSFLNRFRNSDSWRVLSVQRAGEFNALYEAEAAFLEAWRRALPPGK